MTTFLILLSVLTFTWSGDVDGLLEAFHRIDSEKDLLNFEAQLGSTEIPEAPAFAACIEMMKAEHTINPISKLNHFSNGRDQLDIYIDANPDCIVGRYLRLMAQKETPSFLGYKGEIEADESYIRTHLDKSLISVKSKELIEKNLQFTAEKETP